MKHVKLLAVTLFLVNSMCAAVLSQTRITPEAPIGKGIVVLKAARLIDGTGAAPINNAVVIVTDNTITAVGAASAVSVPANAKIIDLGDVTLMPGFIDAHTHLIGRVLGDPAGENALVRDFESFSAILSVQHARATLMAGFTSVRNVGAVFDLIANRRADLFRTVGDAFLDPWIKQSRTKTIFVTVSAANAECVTCGHHSRSGCPTFVDGFA